MTTNHQMETPIMGHCIHCGMDAAGCFSRRCGQCCLRCDHTDMLSFQSTLRTILNSAAHALAEADGYKIPSGFDFTERSDENGVGRYHRRARIAYEVLHGGAHIFDLLARTIPALSVAVDLADTDAHRASRCALLNEVEEAVGPERVKGLMTNDDAHVIVPRRIGHAHEDADGFLCGISPERWAAALALLKLGTSFLACPECGLVLKDRNGKRGVYNHDVVWRGRLRGYGSLEFEYLRSGTTYMRVHGEPWRDTSTDQHAAVFEHLRQMLHGDDR